MIDESTSPRSWSPGPERPRWPTSGEVHVWAASLDEIDTSPVELDLGEQARARQFICPYSAHRFTVGRLMRRRVLGRYFDISPAAITYVAAPYGRPELGGWPGRSGLRFNASDSGDLALLAVTTNTEIGVDVEIVRPFSGMMNIARQYFHPVEWAAIRSFKVGAERVNAFYRCWTRKEAYLKSLGLGLWPDLKCFAVGCERSDSPIRPSGDDQTHVHEPRYVDDILDHVGVLGAIAQNRPLTVLRRWCWRP